MIEHEFLSGTAEARCVHCGTKQGHHRMAAQPCVPRWGGETLRPEPERRVYAIDDAETIHARIVELRADESAALNGADHE